ncbi:hypothetical protein [Cedecea sp.]|jgi:hypothetical protein|uniref:MrpH family fimbial adhesin n=1 Tax=Cedecea sp. TaxID=1970739 RepID=UPI002F421CE9
MLKISTSIPFVLICYILTGNVKVSASETSIEVVSFTSTATSGTLKYIIHDWIETHTPMPANCISSGCEVAVGFHPEIKSGHEILLGNVLQPAETRGLRTTGEVGRLYKRRFGIGSEITLTGPWLINNNSPICFGMKYGVRSGVVAVLPGSQCNYFITNPNPNACYIDGPVSLMYGTVARDAIDQNRASRYTNIRCLNPATINLKISGIDSSSRVRLSDGNTYAQLFINDKLGASGTNVYVGNSRNIDVKISSVLTTTGTPGSGVITGSATLISSFF